MEKAGYLQRTGYRAFDSDGNMHEIIELHILSITVCDSCRPILQRPYPVVYLCRSRTSPITGIITLDPTSGLGQVSVSGKALNIDIFNGGSFTVSLRALGNVMYGKDRFALIMKIPEALHSQKMRRVTLDQKRISAVV